MTAKHIKQRLILALAASLVVLGTSLPALADSYDDQINALQIQVSQQKATAAQFQAQAQDYQTQVDQLQAQINVVVSSISLTDAKLSQLQAAIATATAELAQEKLVLGESIKQMYLSSGQSPLEVLVGSNSLSDYFNKQEYQDKVKSKVQQTMAAVVATQAQLVKDQQTANQDLFSEQGQRQDLAGKQSQVQSLLATAQQSVAAANQQVKSNNAQVSSLRSQQAAAIQAASRSFNGNLPGASGGSGGACDNGHGNGGYPTVWCNAPQDEPGYGGPWGYNRECVSWAGWRRQQIGRPVYAWGNANQWANGARSSGFTVNNTPEIGAVAQTSAGPFGHVAVVEAIQGSNVIVSEINYDGAGHFRYSSYAASYFLYIH